MSKLALAQARENAPALVNRAIQQEEGDGLDAGTLLEAERSLGADLSDVRIHSSPLAGISASAIGANAYTVGRDVVLPGGIDMLSGEGRELLRHELTHAAQSPTRAETEPAAALSISDRSDAHEVEARSVAAGEGASAPLAHAAPANVVSRDDDDPDAKNPILNWGGDANIGNAMTTAGIVADDAQKAFNVAAIADDASKGLGSLSATTKGLGAVAPVLDTANAVLAPIGAADSSIDLGKDIGDIATNGANAGNVEQATEHGLGAVGGGLSTAAGIGTLGGMEGLAALGPAGAVLGAGAAGMATGDYLAKNTDVGTEDVNTVGTIDQAMSMATGQDNWLLNKDADRQAQWDKGGVSGVANSVLDGAEEGLVGLGGAVGGLAMGAGSEAKKWGGKLWDAL